MAQREAAKLDEDVQLVNASGSSSVVLICEHASHFIPAVFDHLGLRDDQRQSHVAWDPGAMGVARRLAEVLDAALVAGAVSRLVYDCNRPPAAADAMPAQSEVVTIPGNIGLTTDQRADRTRTYYEPFRAAVAHQIARTTTPIIVTIHSFTPIFHGQPRTVEIGVLHDADTRLADAMLQTARHHTDAVVQRNQPYGAADGVTHTLKEHAIPGGHLNVMLELRNDLIQTDAEQRVMADLIAAWLVDACAQTHSKGDVTCVA